MSNIAVIPGFIVGAIIGMAFAWLQLQALRRNELLEQQLQVPYWMRQIPGSMGRIAFLLMALVLGQVLLQVLLHEANMIAFASGVVIAYAIPFALRLKDKYSRK